jgi:hypothetical protein
MKKPLLIIALIIAGISIFATTAFAQGRATNDFVYNYRGKLYIAIGPVVPKEGDVDPGMGMTVGLEYAGDAEAAFVDATVTKTGKDSLLSTSPGDVRHTVINVGYKTNFGKWRRWMVGAALQTHKMNFRDHRKIALTVAALAEYKIGKKTSVQFISSQVTKKSDIRFGVFQVNIVRYF